MKIERLSRNKIRIMITSAELMRFDIDVDTLLPNSEELHTFLFHIMETIREETDFNPYSGQIVVEATPSKEGISIIVRRLNRETKKITKGQFNKANSVKAVIKAPERYIFYFENFNDLCDAIKEINTPTLKKCSVYQLEENYCFITDNNKSNARTINILKEFCFTKASFAASENYIAEHGKLIACGDELITMAQNIKKLM